MCVYIMSEFVCMIASELVSMVYSQPLHVAVSDNMKESVCGMNDGKGRRSRIHGAIEGS